MLMAMSVAGVGVSLVSGDMAAKTGSLPRAPNSSMAHCTNLARFSIVMGSAVWSPIDVSYYAEPDHPDVER